MNEIEVKAKITDDGRIIDKLKELGCHLSSPIRQEDRIYTADGSDFSNKENFRNVLRLRQENSHILFTLKRNRSNELDCLEHEVEINDLAEMDRIIQDLGYQEVIRVAKTRQKTVYNNMTICLDKVDGLGDYIEVEKISDEEGEKVQQELFAFLISLGVKPEDRVTQGDDSLIMNKAE